MLAACAVSYVLAGHSAHLLQKVHKLLANPVQLLPQALGGAGTGGTAPLPAEIRQLLVQVAQQVACG